MKSREIPRKEETHRHHSPSSAGEMGKDEVGRGMRILIAIQGYYGERIAENIQRHCPANWKVNHFTFPGGLPAIIDDADEFLPRELPAADLLISLGEHPGVAQMIPDMVKRSGAKAVIAPADNRAWLPFGLARQIQAKVGIHGSGYGLSRPLLYLDRKGQPEPLHSGICQAFRQTRRGHRVLQR